MFGISESGQFTEYKEKTFKNDHLEQALESWLESNPDCILEDGKLLVIGRQVSTRLSSVIDLLAIDGDGNTVVVELKRGRVPRETVAQALEYASFASTLQYEELERIFHNYTSQESPTLTEQHRLFFNLAEGEAVAFNKDQRIVIVGSDISPEIRQTATFLRKRGLRVTCAEFDYFQTKAGEQLMAMSIAVGAETDGNKGTPVGARLPQTDRKKFLDACDDAGRALFEPILSLSTSHHLPIHWGSKGFSLNVAVNGKDINLCYGFPPSAGSGQSLYTAFAEVVRNLKNPSELISVFRQRLEQTGLFVQAGKEMKYVIKRRLSDEEISTVKCLLIDLAEATKKQALVESEGILAGE